MYKYKRKILKEILSQNSTRILPIRNIGKAKDFENCKFDKTILRHKINIKAAKEDIFMDANAVNTNKIDEAVLDLIKKVKSTVNMNEVRARCKQQPDIEKIAEVDFVNGDIVTNNDQVAFKLDYKISYKLCLLLDRKGNLIMDYTENLKK